MKPVRYLPIASREGEFLVRHRQWVVRVWSWLLGVFSVIMSQHQLGVRLNHSFVPHSVAMACEHGFCSRAPTEDCVWSATWLIHGDS